MNSSLITHLIVAAVAAAGAWFFQDARLGADLAEAKLDAKTYELAVGQAQRAADARVAQVGQQISSTYQGALNAAIHREALLRRERDHLLAVSDGLRDQAADAARRLATAPPAAVLEHALTLNAVFDDCRAAYGDMEAKATGHASDVVTHRDGWPVITTTKEAP